MAYTSDNILDKVKDAVYLCEKRFSPVFLSFLNEAEQYSAEEFLSHADCSFRFFGGYVDAVRKILCVSPYEVSEEEFPIEAVWFKYRKADVLSHRDVLGSLMGLGLERDCVGDILFGEGCAVVYLKEEIADYVKSQISKIGRVGVQIAAAEQCQIDHTPKTEELSFTVSSMRLDVIVATITGLSREKTAAFIMAGKTFVNYREEKNVSRLLKPGDILTVRGKGKYIVGESFGLTKKGRLRINLLHYI